MRVAADLRRGVRSLTALADADARSVLRRARTADGAQEALLNLLPPLTESYRLASASLAADWYDGLRDQHHTRRRFAAIVPDIGDGGADVLARWSVGPLYAETPDWDAAIGRLTGGLQQKIADAARDVVTDSSIEDPDARGWQRETSGGCEFCEMLAGRGAVFSEASADFAAHNNCECYAVPAFAGAAKPVKAYTPSLRRSSDVDRERVRSWIRDHRGDG